MSDAVYATYIKRFDELKSNVIASKAPGFCRVCSRQPQPTPGHNEHAPAHPQLHHLSVFHTPTHSATYAHTWQVNRAGERLRDRMETVFATTCKAK